jgi:hypothetical protein
MGMPEIGFTRILQEQLAGPVVTIAFSCLARLCE